MKKYRELPAQTRGEFQIPAGDVPTTTRCIMLQIPDSDAAYKQLAGVLYELTHWNNYEREESHKATQWASAWRDAILAQPLFEGCDMSQLIQFQQDNCGLQVSYDGGESWEIIYDATSCVNGIIDGLIEDGVLQQNGGQPSPSQQPEPGTCLTYHVVLNGANKWKIPYPLSTGDTIQVSNAKGGWTDGAYLWYCWNGKAYILGDCGNDQAPDPSDPLQSGNHMQLIGIYNETTPVPFDLVGGLYTIPSGVLNQETWLQANDSQLYDNQGDIEFDVEVCIGGWCVYLDFALSSNTDNMTVDDGSYNGAGYYEGTYRSGAWRVSIHLATISASTRVRHVEMTYSNGGGNPDSVFLIDTGDSPDFGEGDHKLVTFNISVQPTDVAYYLGAQSNSIRMFSLKMSGTGDNPFTINNC